METNPKSSLGAGQIASFFFDAVRDGLSKVRSKKSDREKEFQDTFVKTLKVASETADNLSVHVSTKDVEALTGVDVWVIFTVDKTTYHMSLQIKQLFSNYPAYLAYAKNSVKSGGKAQNHVGDDHHPYFDITYKSKSVTAWAQAMVLQDSHLDHLPKGGVSVAGWLVFSNDVAFVILLEDVAAVIAPGLSKFEPDQVSNMNKEQFEQIYTSRKVLVKRVGTSDNYESAYECRLWFNTFLKKTDWDE